MPSDEAIEGLQSLLDSMEGLELSKQKNLIARALRKGAQPIIQAAKRRAPNDPATPGNRIADNITVAVREQTASGAVAEIGPTRKGFMGHFAENGTRRGQPARPWLAPAFDETHDDALELLADELGEGIDQEFSKRR